MFDNTEKFQETDLTSLRGNFQYGNNAFLINRQNNVLTRRLPDAVPL